MRALPCTLDFARSPMLASWLLIHARGPFPTRYQSMRMPGHLSRLSPAVLFAVVASALLLPSWSGPMSGQPLPRLFDGSFRRPRKGRARRT